MYGGTIILGEIAVVTIMVTYKVRKENSKVRFKDNLSFMNNEMTYDSSFCNKNFRRDRHNNQLGGKQEAWGKKSLCRGLHMHVT